MKSISDKKIQYSALRPGPETDLQHQLEYDLESIYDFGKDDCFVWTGGSVPVGAGQPDLIVARCQPEIRKLIYVEAVSHLVLGYVRTVSRARRSTISDRIGYSLKRLESVFDDLEANGILVSNGDTLSMPVVWRCILEDMIAVEVKVSDWRRAAYQALRNTILVHRSYVALPSSVAHRVQNQEVFRTHGIGVLSIDDTGVRTVRRARRAQPKVWSYYYALAFHASAALGEQKHAISGAD